MELPILKIVSGGQTGADRAALDWAIEHGVQHGGWCPKGRRAEDGRIDGCYKLTETPTANYLQRTEWNVRDSDVTVIFSISETLTGGSKRTEELARKHGKPCLHLSEERAGAGATDLLREFLRRQQARVLNVAGPRASNEPGIGEFVKRTLGKALLNA